MVVEQLLRPEALQQLLTFLSESTIYHASLLGGRQLAASLAEGLSAPLIAQLAEELRAAFPSILGKHTLRDGWAFKYDNTLYGTATASAEAEVTAAEAKVARSAMLASLSSAARFQSTTKVRCPQLSASAKNSSWTLVSRPV